MNRVLVIDQDRRGMEAFTFECLRRRVDVRFAENVCEGVRALLDETYSLIAVDAGLLRLPLGEHARLFERVAPGVPVVVVLPADAPVEMRTAFDLVGFRAITRPLTPDSLVVVGGEARPACAPSGSV